LPKFRINYFRIARITILINLNIKFIGSGNDSNNKWLDKHCKLTVSSSHRSNKYQF